MTCRTQDKSNTRQQQSCIWWCMLCKMQRSICTSHCENSSFSTYQGKPKSMYKTANVTFQILNMLAQMQNTQPQIVTLLITPGWNYTTVNVLLRNYKLNLMVQNFIHKKQFIKINKIQKLTKYKN